MAPQSVFPCVRGHESAVRAEALRLAAAVAAGLGGFDRSAPTVQAEALRAGLRLSKDLSKEAPDPPLLAATIGTRCHPFLCTLLVYSP